MRLWCASSHRSSRLPSIAVDQPLRRYPCQPDVHDVHVDVEGVALLLARAEHAACAHRRLCASTFSRQSLLLRIHVEVRVANVVALCAGLLLGLVLLRSPAILASHLLIERVSLVLSDDVLLRRRKVGPFALDLRVDHAVQVLLLHLWIEPVYVHALHLLVTNDGSTGVSTWVGMGLRFGSLDLMSGVPCVLGH